MHCIWQIARACALCCMAATAAARGTDLIVNGSFESPANPIGSDNFYTSIPGWTLSFGDAIEVQNNVAGTAFAGNQFIELDSDQNSGIQQVIPTVPGVLYDFNFAYSPRPGIPASSNVVEVRVNGSLIDTITQDGSGLPDTSWSRHQYNVLATSGSTTVDLRAAGTSDSLGGYVDDVHFIAPVSASPVPTLSGWSLIGLSGLLALGLLAVSAMRRKA